MKIQDLSLKVKIGTILFISLLLNLCGYFIMLQFIDDHKLDSSHINVAGSQRMLIQQMVNQAHQYADGNVVNIRRLKESTEEFSYNLNMLKQTKSTIPSMEFPKITNQLIEVEQDWQTFSGKINELLQEKNKVKTQLILREIQHLSSSFLEETIELTSLFEKNSEHKVTTIKYIQITIMLVNVSVFLFAFWACINHIINPITYIVQQMQKVVHGEMNIEKIQINRKDEVGTLALVYNNMVANLKHLLLTGKKQTNFLAPPYQNEVFEIKTIYKPSEFVSGDFFHYIWDNDNNHLYGYVIDVMGHGLATALHTSTLHVLFEQAAHKKELSLVEKVEWINNESTKFFTDETFAAGICFEFDFSSKQLKYVSCGINYFIANTNKHNELVTVEGALIGIMENMPFEEHEISFQSGNYFYFITDGLSDHLDDCKLKANNSFEDTYEMIVNTSNNNIIKDDVSALCFHVK